MNERLSRDIRKRLLSHMMLYGIGRIALLSDLKPSTVNNALNGRKTSKRIRDALTVACYEQDKLVGPVGR